MTSSALAQTCACGVSSGGVVIQAEEPPPPLPIYDQPPIPEPGYLWTPGYWSYNNEDYYWVPGTWVEPPRPGVLWTPGYWGFAGGVYVFNRGYWGPHIGFYGGIPYGFGYGGSGYQGGRWDNGVFFYNRSVNNVRNVHITNVYNETVVNNVSNSRVAFNGGEGGVAAKPTAEELVAAKEPHEKPTPLQLEHRRAAALNPGSFAATNHGRPAVAATAKPGVLKGPGVVKAKVAVTPVEGTPVKDEKLKGETAPTEEPSKKLKKLDNETKPTPSEEKIETKPKPASSETKPVMEKKPKVEKPLEDSKPGVEKPLEESKPKPEKSDAERKPKPEKPAVESHPTLEKSAVKPAMEAKPKVAPVEAKPEPGAKKPECGHPGQPACK